MTGPQMQKVGQELFGVEGWYLMANKAYTIASKNGIPVAGWNVDVITSMTLNTAIHALLGDGWFVPLSAVEHTPEGIHKFIEAVQAKLREGGKP